MGFTCFLENRACCRSGSVDLDVKKSLLLDQIAIISAPSPCSSVPNGNANRLPVS